MQAINSSADMETGKVYNLMYQGPNESYRKINGKRTILVLEVKPEFKYVKLYSMFGNPWEDDIRGQVCTVGRAPSKRFPEDEIFEPESESEYIKHALKYTSLTDAVAHGVLTPEQIKKHPVHSTNSPFVSVSNSQSKHIGIYTRFDVEGKTTQPYLQSVFVWWDDWQKMDVDFAQYEVSLRS